MIHLLVFWMPRSLNSSRGILCYAVLFGTFYRDLSEVDVVVEYVWRSMGCVGVFYGFVSG